MSSIEVNEAILNKIFLKARVLEGNNLRTGQYSDADMVKTIIRIIDAEIQEGEKENEV